MGVRKRLPSYQDKLYCSTCKTERIFELQENIKKCNSCLEKTSYKADYRKRWVKEKSDPSRLSEEKAIYFRPACPDNAKEQFNAVMGRMHKLSQKEYEVIQLLWEGKTIQETAEILDLSHGNITTLLNRARTKLK